MKEENNILDNIGNKNPFTVPDNYFENLAANIDKQISSNDENVNTITEEKTVTVPMFQKLKPYFYAAAMFVMIFFAATYISDKNKNEGNNIVSTEEYSFDINDVNDVFLSSFDENVIIEYYIENE